MVIFIDECYMEPANFISISNIVVTKHNILFTSRWLVKVPMASRRT